MSILNNKTKYGLLSKLFHWLTAAGLIVQIPLGFYLVDLDFDQSRVDIENYHILFGLIIFYATLIRLIFKLLTTTPDFKDNAFPGQKFLAKLNHILLSFDIMAMPAAQHESIALERFGNRLGGGVFQQLPA